MRNKDAEVTSIDPQGVVSMPVDSDGWANLYAGHHRRLRGLAAAVTFDQSIADEIVHDAYAGLFACKADVENPVGYLQRSVINLSINATRRRRLFRALPQRRAQDVATPEVDEMWSAIGELPARQRAVVVLRFYEDQSHAQIAEILGIPIGTVKSTLHRALNTLKERLT